MPKHTVRAFAAELHDLARKVQDMGTRAEAQIKDAFQALTKRDAELARSVIVADDAVDELQHDIEKEAISIIARRQPIAVDLREIVGALRISNDLERIADLAENIAKRSLMLSGEAEFEYGLPELSRIIDLVIVQLCAVLRSYRQRDSSAALAVWHRDREVDEMHESLFRELLTYMMKDQRQITICAHLLFCAKNVERIGDHVTNIAETIYYIVEGRALVQEQSNGGFTDTPAAARHSASQVMVTA